MSDDQFTKLFKYMQDFRQEMMDRFAQVDAEFRKVYGILDSILKQQEAHEQERLFTNYQIDRHKGWIVQLAKNTKTKLAPDP